MTDTGWLFLYTPVPYLAAMYLGAYRQGLGLRRYSMGTQWQRTVALEGTPAKPSRVVREILDELARSGAGGEELAAAFREMANRSALVRELQEARKNGEPFKRAREPLKSERGRGLAAGPQVGAEQLKLRRVCWCWVQPTPHKTLSDASRAPPPPPRPPSWARTP
jgi:hypothetical protein